jgi:hypothetical protein
MNHMRNADALLGYPIKDQVFAHWKTAVTRSQIIAAATRMWKLTQKLEFTD